MSYARSCSQLLAALVPIGLLAGCFSQPPTGHEQDSLSARITPVSGCQIQNPVGITEAAARPYITRLGDQLMEGQAPFRFFSFNSPTLLDDEHYPTESDPVDDAFENEDTIKSIAQLRGRVTRSYVIKTQTAYPRTDTLRKHVTWDANGNIQFDEQLFQQIDHLLELANHYGVRLIIPLVETSSTSTSGGVPIYAASQGGQRPDHFWSDPMVRNEFKKMITFLLTRVNTRTCIRYSDDPAILAWETGNELDQDTAEWTEDIAGFIKGLDANHLVMDGHYGIKSSSLLATSNIDIVSDHFYVQGSELSASKVAADRAQAFDQKPFIAGEIGTNGGGEEPDLVSCLQEAYQDGTAGAMVWALRGHSRDGGFKFLCDHSSPNSCSYHYPGFPAASFTPYFQMPTEVTVFTVVRTIANLIAGLPELDDGRTGSPDMPQALTVQPSGSGSAMTNQMSWRGVAGADRYLIERTDSPTGAWTTLATTDDDKPTPSVLFTDNTAYTLCEAGPVNTWIYRVTAQFVSSTGAVVSGSPSAGAGVTDACCTPATCASIGATCGLVPDGCGGTLSCGTCDGLHVCDDDVHSCVTTSTCRQSCASEEQECLADGTQLPSACVTGEHNCIDDCCVPATCAQRGASCGSISDGCGGTLSCGNCPTTGTSTYACENNQCVCIPQTSCAGKCGPQANGCGGVFNCVSCTCTPNCPNNARCGQGNGCGGYCSEGSCPRVDDYCGVGANGRPLCVAD